MATALSFTDSPLLSSKQIHAELVSLVTRVRALDLCAYEALSRAALGRELLPRVAGLVAEAQELVARVLVAPTRARAAARDVAEQSDRAFLGSLELAQRTARLERVARDGSAVDVLVECDSALRRVRKVLVPVEGDLADVLGVPRVLGADHELESSLLARQASARVRALVLSDGTPSDEELDRRLRLASTTLVLLHGWDAYRHFRIADRLALDGLRGRVLGWLQSEQDAVVGRRLWNELARTLRLLAHVSHRGEVVEHDQRVVREASQVLLGRAEGPVPPRVLAALERLEGLSDAVDAVLASDERHTSRAWMPVLARLGRCFRATTPPPGLRPSHVVEA